MRLGTASGQESRHCGLSSFALARLKHDHATLRQEREFFTRAGVLREGVAMKDRVIQEHDRCCPIRMMRRALAMSPTGVSADAISPNTPT